MCYSMVNEFDNDDEFLLINMPRFMMISRLIDELDPIMARVSRDNYASVLGSYC